MRNATGFQVGDGGEMDKEMGALRSQCSHTKTQSAFIALLRFVVACLHIQLYRKMRRATKGYSQGTPTINRHYSQGTPMIPIGNTTAQVICVHVSATREK